MTYTAEHVGGALILGFVGGMVAYAALLVLARTAAGWLVRLERWNRLRIYRKWNREWASAASVPKAPPENPPSSLKDPP